MEHSPRQSMVSLEPLPLYLLPPHPDIPSTDTSLPLPEFLHLVFADAEKHIQKFKPIENNVADKSSPPSTAKVAIHTVDGWAVRRSVHVDQAIKGSASWKEFESALKDQHAKHEAEYTPTIKWTNHALNWEITGDAAVVDGWNVTEFAVYETCHHLPFPLSDRIFQIVIISAVHTDGNSFQVISIPVHSKTGLGPDFPNSKASQGDKAALKATYGRYAAVERLSKLPAEQAASADGTSAVAGGRIEWIMGTESDAGGNLPKFIQEKAIPAEIVKDVGLCLTFIEKHRK